MKTLHNKPVDFEKQNRVFGWKPACTLRMKSTSPSRQVLLLTIMVTVLVTSVSCFEKVAWSPDGTRIAYSYSLGTKKHEIAIHDRRTGKTATVYRFARGKDPGPWAWSTDGNHLIVLDQVKSRATLLVIDPATQEVSQRFSLPKGTRYRDVEPHGSDVFLIESGRLTRLALDTGEMQHRELDSLLPVTSSVVGLKTLFSVGDVLYYRMKRSGGKNAPYELGRIDPLGLELSPYLEYIEHAVIPALADPAFSGNQIACLGETDKKEVMLHVRLGRELQRSIPIQFDVMWGSPLRWSDDMSSVYGICHQEQTKQVGLCEVFVDDGQFNFRKLPLTSEVELACSLAAFSPDGKMIAWRKTGNTMVMNLDSAVEESLVPSAYLLPAGYDSLGPGVVLSGYQFSQDITILNQVQESLASYLFESGVLVANPLPAYGPIVVGEIGLPMLQETIREGEGNTLLHLTVSVDRSSFWNVKTKKMKLQCFDHNGQLLWEIEGTRWSSLKRKLRRHLGQPGLEVLVAEKSS